MRGLAIAWRAEQTKALATKVWLAWGLVIFISAVGLSVLMGALIISFGTDDVSEVLYRQDVARSVYTSALPFCYLMAFAAGVKVYAGERRQVSLPMTLLIAPRRIHAVLAKYVLGLVLGLWCGIAYVVGVLIGGGSVLVTHGQALIPTIGVVRTLMVMLTLFALWCVFGVGLGMCLAVIPALLTGFALAFVLPAATSSFLSTSLWGRKLITLFPGVATNMSTEPETGEFGVAWLPWWGSYTVLVLWVLLVTVLGSHAVLRAEIDVD